MGASGLKTKPVRLIFTILLSVVAFVLFGIVSTFMLYDANYSVSEALKQADYPSLTVSKSYIVKNQSYKVDNVTGEEKLDYEYEQTYTTRFGVQELADKNQATNGAYAGIFNFTNDKWASDGQGISIMVYAGTNPITPNVGTTIKDYYPIDVVYGFTDCGADYMSRNGFTFIGEGRYPQNKTEVAIPEYIANVFVESSTSYTTASDVVGTKMKFTSCNAIPSSEEFTIVGVYKIGEIPAKYETLKDSTSTELSAMEKEQLKDSLKDYLKNSYNTLIYVSDDFYDAYKNNIVSNNGGINVNGYYARGVKMHINEITEDFMEWWGESVYTEKTVRDYSKYMKLYDLEGNPISNDTFTIGDNQVYISKSTVNQELGWRAREYFQEIYNSLRQYDATAKEMFTQDALNSLMNNYDMSDYSEYVALISQWYPMLKEKQSLITTVEQLSWYNSLPSNVMDAFSRIRQEVTNETPENINNADWLTLKTWVDENVKPDGAYEQHYYYSFAERMYYMASERLDELNQQLVTTNDLWQVVWAMRENHADAQDFAVVKGMLLNGTYREIVGSDLPEYSQRYMPDFDVIYEKIYYKNYAGLTGEL
ncbi:MAG: hypothetical protein J6R83_03410, partial [Clostridia bacterium]|nr:hypothetical protein [Clostridia bacterium]